MGKIFKALEKSRKEHKGESKSSSYSSRGALQRDKLKLSADEKNRRSDSTKPASSKLDLGSIHELLNDSPESGATKLNEIDNINRADSRNVSASQKIPKDSATGWAKSKQLPQDVEKATIIHAESIEETGYEKAADSKIPVDNKTYLRTDKSQPMINQPEVDQRIEKTTGISIAFKKDTIDIDKNNALEPNGGSAGKALASKERTLKDSLGEDIEEDTADDDVRKNERSGFVVDSSDYSAVNGSLIALTKPRSYEAEQFKILRTNLLFPESGKPTKSILVTSAGPGDGKSFVSANLAVSLALDKDRKVLLIDADVRRSEIHKIFGLNRVENGVCNFLTDHIPLSSLLVRTSLKNLLVLPAGELTHDADELRSLEKLPKLFEEIAVNYGDYCVVVDSPPPKLASETGVLSRLVDSIVIVVKAGVTRKEYVEDTLGLLDKEKIAGIVFNWYESSMSNYKKYAKNRDYYSS
jgi:protein-tyrosine kinase